MSESCEYSGSVQPAASEALFSSFVEGECTASVSERAQDIIFSATTVAEVIPRISSRSEDACTPISAQISTENCPTSNEDEDSRSYSQLDSTLQDQDRGGQRTATLGSAGEVPTEDTEEDAPSTTLEGDCKTPLAPSPSKAGTGISDGQEAISLFDSPMEATDRGHEGISLYAPVEGRTELEEVKQGFSREYGTRGAIFQLVPSSTFDDEPDYEDEVGDPGLLEGPRESSPDFPGGGDPPSSSPGPYVPLLRSSSPIQRTSSPPTSSPPPISSPLQSPVKALVVVPTPFGDRVPNANDVEGNQHVQDFFGLQNNTLSQDKSAKLRESSNNERENRGEEDQLKLGLPLPPNPIRPTAAAWRKQHKKLSQPFRPLRVKAILPGLQTPAVITTTTDRETDDKGVSSTRLPTNNSIDVYQGPKKVNGSKNRTRVAVQFKSPLVTNNSCGLPDWSSAARLTPEIQMLERRLQILKRAVKIKEDKQEGVLQGLIAKWTEAGREIAWEVWGLVKDNSQSVENNHISVNGKRPVQADWWWETGDDKRRKGESRFYPHSEAEDDSSKGTDTTERFELMGSISLNEEESERYDHTLGTMLRQLGIDPQSFGWDDQEETFKDPDGSD